MGREGGLATVVKNNKIVVDNLSLRINLTLTKRISSKFEDNLNPRN